MELLLDTHVLIWFLNGDRQLPINIERIIADPTNRCYLSIASIWEIAIKSSLGKLELQGDLSMLVDFLYSNDIQTLPITFSHILYLQKMPFYHRDPFDRMLIAQSAVEDYTLLSRDAIFPSYGIKVLWA